MRGPVTSPGRQERSEKMKAQIKISKEARQLSAQSLFRPGGTITPKEAQMLFNIRAYHMALPNVKSIPTETWMGIANAYIFAHDTLAELPNYEALLVEYLPEWYGYLKKEAAQ